MEGINDLVRAAIYCRVSTEEQAREEKVSLGQQRERCEAYCKAQDWQVAEVYVDAGVSGTKADRPALTRMLADGTSGNFERLVFYKIDRLARNARHLLNICAAVEEQGVGIVSLQEGFDTATPAGRAYRTMIAAFAEFERDQIVERTFSGKLGRAGKGYWNGGQVPYGYDVSSDGSRLVVKEGEASVVRQVFSMYVRDGLPQRAIADRLNSIGVPTKTDRISTRSVDGIKKGWWRGQISRLINNRVYLGEAHFNKTTRRKDGQNGPWVRRLPKDEWLRIDCPAIIDELLWQAAQDQATRNLRWGQLPADRKTKYFLSGLIRCHCGRTMYGRTVRRQSNGRKYCHRYYCCVGQLNYGTDCRSGGSVAAAKLEEPVLDAVIYAYSDPRRSLENTREYTERLIAEETEQRGRAAELRKKLSDTDEERDRLVALCAKASISEQQLRRQLGRLDAEVAGYEGELGRMDEATRQLTRVNELKEVLEAIAEQIGWLANQPEEMRHVLADMEFEDTQSFVGTITLQEHKELLRSLIECVWVGPQNEVRIECVVPDVLRRAPHVHRRAV